MKYRSYSTALSFFCAVMICLFWTTSEANENFNVWPTGKWKVSNPKVHGVDSRQINKIIARTSIKGNILIIRHGYIIAEYYKNEKKRDFSPNIYSCTKGIVSALVGQAIDQGFIKGVHQSVLDYFPDYDYYKSDKRKRKITIYHLLTMSSGLQGNEGFSEFNQIYLQPDWSKFILSKKVVADPGTIFNYNSVNAHLLSAILQEATNMTAYEYAKRNLFDPLGISIKSWEQNRQKENIGGWGIRMSLGDMAKFGYLYLREGRWENKQIIPSDWIKETIKKHKDQSGDWAGWGYGYNWNILPEVPQFTYSLIGGGGQKRYLVTVIPKLDIVTVYAGPLHHNQVFDLFRKHLYSAVDPMN